MARKLVFAMASWCRQQTLRWQNQRAASDRASINTVGGQPVARLGATALGDDDSLSAIHGNEAYCPRQRSWAFHRFDVSLSRSRRRT
jgi:hypothetical protein